jgi:integrase
VSEKRPDWKRYVSKDGKPQPRVEVRHRPRCKKQAPGCKCRPEYRVSVPLGKSGKRTYAYGASIAEARANAGQARAAYAEKRRRGQVGEQTLNEASAQYVVDLRAGVILTRGKASTGQAFKPRSADDRADCLRILCDGLPEETRDGVLLPAVPGLGGMRVPDVRHSDLARLLEQIARRRSASRCNRVLDAARCLYRRLEQIDHDFQDPIRWNLVERRRIVPRDLGELDATQLLALLDVLEARERAAYSLGEYLGLRIAEIQALRPRDIAVKAGIIHVRWAWDEKHRMLVPTKSDAGVRDLPLIGPVLEALAPLLAHSGRDAFLFANPRTGLPVKGDTIRTNARKQWLAAGLDSELLPHVARHLAISIWAAAGVDKRTRFEMAGHASERVNLAYTHPIREERLRAGERVERFVESIRAVEAEPRKCWSVRRPWRTNRYGRPISWRPNSI